MFDTQNLSSSQRGFSGNSSLLDSTWDDFYACAAVAEHYLALARGFAEVRDLTGIKYCLRHAGPNFRFIAGSIKDLETQAAANARDAA